LASIIYLNQKLFFINIIFFTLFLSSTLFANNQSTKTYTLGYGKIEGFIESHDKGVGVDLLNEIVKRMHSRGHKIQLHYQPFKRIINNFIKNDFDIIFPIINAGSFKKAGYEKWGFKQMPAHSMPMFTSGGFIIYSTINHIKYDSINSLLGKRVGVIRGAYVPSILKDSKEIFVTELNKGVQSFKMLSKKRLDAFLVQKFWAQGILNESKLEGFHHGKEFDTVMGSFIFHQNQEGLNLLAEFNYVIGSMILDKTYQKILDNYPNNKMVIKYPR